MYVNHNGLSMILQRIVAATALVVLAPLGAIVALLIRGDSPGPILFTQNRVGQMGRTFRIYKFRTMHVDQRHHKLESERGGLCFKMRKDPRVTRIGYWLRRGSLDELPQLINIVKGEMSFIGPRPFLMEYVSLYSDYHSKRHAVMPGITGLAQVWGKNRLDWKRKLDLDVQYVENIGLALDFKIILLTIRYFLNGCPGSYPAEKFTGYSTN